MADCIFCNIISGIIPSKMISESGDCIAILDAFPLAAGHVLVMPRRHCERIQELDAGEVCSLFAMVSDVVSRVESVLSADAMVVMHNGPCAGQAIRHVHVHVIPRTAGDSAGHLPDLFDGNVASDPAYDADATRDALARTAS